MLNKRIFIAAALLLGWSSYGQNVLTLDNALSLALEHNHDLHIARLEAEQAANSVTQGNAGRLPSLTASAGTNYSNQNSNLEFATGQTQDVEGAESLSQNASLGVRQVLFAGGRIQRSYQLLNSAKNAADLAQKQAMENTIAQVWSQYTGISLLQRTVATAAENFNISKERFDKAQLTNELGGSNSTDLMAAKVDMNRDKVELMEAETQLESAKNSFAAFIGYEDAFTVSDQTGLNLEEHFDEEETLEIMRAGNTALLLAGISAETARIQQQLQQATLFPTIAAQASYGLNQSQDRLFARFFKCADINPFPERAIIHPDKRFHPDNHRLCAIYWWQKAGPLCRPFLLSCRAIWLVGSLCHHALFCDIGCDNRGHHWHTTWHHCRQFRQMVTAHIARL